MQTPHSDPVREYLSILGRKGAAARAASMTPEQRSKQARKAAKASAKVRRAKSSAAAKK